MNLSEIASHKSLSTEEKCIAYLAKMRWPEGIKCPACGNQSISRFRAKGKSGKVRQLYQCLGKTCRYQFSPLTGTIFHDSHLPLNKWFQAIALVCDAERPLSTNQLRLALGVQYKTAAHLSGRIRQAMTNGSIELEPGPDKHSPGVVAAGPSQALQGRPAAPLGRSKGLGGPSAVSMKSSHTVLAQRRAATADLLNQLAKPPGKESVSSTAVDNMLSMFVSMAQLTVRPPIFFVNYLKDKVFT